VDQSSVELVNRWRNGDQHAAEALFEQYTGRLLALAQSRLSNKLALRVDAEDVVQSVYRSFFAHAKTGGYVLERSGDLWRLLVAITLNKVRSQASHHTADKRSMDREQRAALDEWEGLSVAALTREPTPLEAAVLADELEHVMRQLDPTRRQMFELRLQGYSVEEIATACDRGIRTVKRGLGQIREELQRARNPRGSSEC
jgi:RNA polymerase sigma-70 factor (ECF subfamily)